MNWHAAFVFATGFFIVLSTFGIIATFSYENGPRERQVMGWTLVMFAFTFIFDFLMALGAK